MQSGVASYQQHSPLGSIQDNRLFDISETRGFIVALLDLLFSLLYETTVEYPEELVLVSCVPLSEANTICKIDSALNNRKN